MITKLYPIIENIREGGCLARQKRDHSLQCPRRARKDGLCGFCNKRKIPAPRVDEVYLDIKKKIRRIKILKVLTPEDIINTSYGSISVNSLKKTLKKYQIPFLSTDRKPALFTLLDKHFVKLYPYLNETKNIVKIQTIFRNYSKNKILRLRGPGYKNPKLCVNETDFYTCENLIELDKKYLFTYKNNGFIYGFDIRSFKKLLEFSTNNPYDKSEISIEIIKRFNELDKLCGDSLDKIEPDKLTSKQKWDQEVMSVFSKLDSLDYYTNMTWFNNLSRNKLILFYIEAEDIWSFRAGLTPDAQKNIVPDRKPFPLVNNRSPKKLLNIKTTKLRKLCLEEIDVMISSGNTKPDKVLGALYIMSALVMVSKGAYASYSHLWNPSNLCHNPPS